MSLPDETQITCGCEQCGSGSTGVCSQCGAVCQQVPGGNYNSIVFDSEGVATQPGPLGTNTSANGQPVLVRVKRNTTVVAVVLSLERIVRFDESGDTYTLRNGNASDFTLTWNQSTCRFTFVDNCSNDSTYTFDENSGFVSRTSAGGNTTQVSELTPDGKIAKVSKTAMVGGVQVTRYTKYTYVADGPNKGQIASVTVGQSTNPAADLRRTLYTYYVTGEAHGNAGDLKTVTEQIFQDGQWHDHETTYYRYYQAGEPNGFEHGMKYLVGSSAFERLKNDPQVPDPLTASDEKVAQYADNYYEYDSAQRATKASVQGGLLTYTYSYTTSAFGDDPNNWRMKSVTTNPDGSQQIVFSNYLSQVMLRELTDGTNRWIDYYKYDADARQIEHATPAAIDMSGTPYDSGQADLNVQLKSSAGLIEVTDYYSSTTATETTAGGVEGYVEFTKIKQGSGGTEIKLAQTKYFKRTVGQESSYPVAEAIVFKDMAGAEPITTKYQYEWYTGQTQVKQRTTLLPIVPTSQNGTGLQESQVEVFDSYSRVVWSMDARGFITYTSYNDLTGAMVQQIRDVDMTKMTGYPLNPGWTTPTGGGLHLITDYENDELGRTTQMLGPSHSIDGQSTRTATWTVYKDLDDETLSAQGYATGTSADYQYTLVNPVTITKTAVDGSYSRTVATVRSATNGPLSAGDTFSQSTWIRWTESFNNRHGQQTASRVYHSIPASGEGTAAANFDETTYGYDDMNRQNMMRSPGGTIDRTVFDVRGQAIQTWVGTADAAATQAHPNGDDSNPEGNAPGNNMKIVRANEYDDGNDGGNGNLTQLTQHVDASTTRVTSYGYDFRNRRTEIDGEVDFFQINSYDNLDHVVQVQRKDTTSGGNLIAQSETEFDDRGRVYQSIVYAVDPSTGTTGNTLTDNTWYDPDGNVLKSHPAGSDAFAKSTYDGVGRQTAQYTAFYDGSGTDDPASLTDNKVFEQVQTNYDEADNVIGLATLARYNDGSGNGALVAGSNARPSYSASWYDGVGRVVAAASYGNQGNDSTAFTRPDGPPNSSDDVLVTQTGYNAGGDVFETVDAKGIVNRTIYDNAGRTIRTIENAVDGVESPGDDENVTTEMTYNPDGNLLTLTARNPATGDQVTTYQYGTTLADSDLATSQLLRAEIYPDTADGADQVRYTYNRQGERTSTTDQNGTVREPQYDGLGRQTADKVTTLGSGVDGAVLRIDTGYEVRGMVNVITSYDNAVGTGTPVNQVQQTYNDFAQLEKEEQEHDGAVDGSTLAVEYAYADGSNNTIRPTSVTYPDGRVLTLDYGSGDDDTLSRIATLDWNGTDVSSYTYLGASSIVKEEYPEPSVALDYIGSGNSYSGFDRFGRVVDQKWTGPGGNLDQFLYGYDRNSNRTYRENTVAAAQTTPVHLDELYAYDRLNRLTQSHRGELDDGNRITDHQLSQIWQLDATGNWKQFSNYDQATSADVLIQQRTHNAVNEITDIGETVGSQWVTPAHDRNGNMTTIPQPNMPTTSFTGIYDAWNRLVEIKDGATTVGRYNYDALNRRVRKFVPGSPDSFHHFYYNNAWQVLETRQASTAPVPATAQYQYVWSLRYIDAPVLRDDRAADPDEILYFLDDANFNVTSLIDIAGEAVERYIYAPYGSVTIYNADWSMTRSSAQFDNNYLYTGRRRDIETGLFYYRARYYDPQLGRFISRDPLGYIGSQMCLYEYATGAPINRLDPSGKQGLDDSGWRAAPRCKITAGPYYNLGGIATPTYGGGIQRWQFTMIANFSDDLSKGECCTCCEVRQDIQWNSIWHTGWGGPPHAGFAPPDNTHSTWHEDRDATNSQRYGHRIGFGGGVQGNQYLNAANTVDQENGCKFRGEDNPSGPDPIGFAGGVWKFRLRVVDRCQTGWPTISTKGNVILHFR